MRLLTERAPLHGAITEAEAEVTALEGQLADAQGKLTELQTKREQLERDLREARIAVEMGDNPPRLVAELKAEIEVVRDQQESNGARVIGVQRQLTSAREKVEGAKAALRRAQFDHCEKSARQHIDKMNDLAHKLQEVQQELISLSRVMQGMGFDPGEVSRTVPTYLVFTEIVATRGADKRIWPVMGDRMTGDSMLATKMAALREQLDAL